MSDFISGVLVGVLGAILITIIDSLALLKEVKKLLQAIVNDLIKNERGDNGNKS